MTIKFYNRKKELELLEKVRKPFLSIIYGRRRIGKTALALKFVENKDHIYFFINPKKSENLLLEEFSEKLKEKMGLEEYVRPKNWEEFFSLLFKYKGIVIFDEFQWFLEINKSVPYILQKYWDTERKKPTIILTGSIIGMIKKLFEESGSPLFGRADIKIHLKELPVSSVFEILEDLGIRDVKEKFKLYLIFGGVPYYYKLMEKYGVKHTESAIKTLILDELSPLRYEVENVLVEAFKREYRTYLSILLAIAEGKTKLEEIASYAGIKVTSLPYYLRDLIDLLDIVEKQKVSFKRKYIYLIKDRFYEFWLRFVYKYSSIENIDLLFEKIKKNLNYFFGWSFELTVRENILKIFPNFERIIKYYGAFRKNGKRETFEIDIVALNENTKEILFGECKWSENVNPYEICKDLVKNKIPYVDWYNDKRKEYIAIFAKSFKERIDEFEGRRVYCFDLRDLESILK